MSFEISNFIYRKDGAFDDDKCDKAIDYILSIGKDASRTSTGSVYGDSQFPSGKLGRDDFQIFLPHYSDPEGIFKDIQDCIFDGLEEYRHVISSVQQQVLTSSVAKIQHTPVNGGYHEWHCEQDGGSASTRSLVWAIYLNTIEKGGETEFLYQQERVQATKGTLVIFPAGITHPHRGNPPYSSDKFIITGWFDVAHSDECHYALMKSRPESNGKE